MGKVMIKSENGFNVNIICPSCIAKSTTEYFVSGEVCGICGETLEIIIQRENEKGKKELSINEFIDELKFQIAESYEVLEDFENQVDITTIEEYQQKVFGNYIETLNNNYSIEIMGDTYCFK